ncbi:DNA-processing protein DprA [Microbacterium sp. SORGH_AS_0888]|uniref:DNA-processing protein DprA n=1 Tax=Microbacterium sp. SORGH_AS_0888 TaxID=3041791 RepID=UPI002786D3E1|nr:DNA-processing protein DprA [Microbacterium sp. SORGH_AS_0888]MDQ1128794.1 DNA processing protein [Microbacterium sp. SORGH_AS_0888]
MTAPPLDALLTAAGEASAVAGAPDDPATPERAARALWATLAEPGDGVAGALVAALGAAESYRRVFVAQDGRAASDAGIAPAELRAGTARWIPRLGEHALARTLVGASRCHARLLTPDSEHWPAGADDLGAHAPLCVWVRGRVPRFDAAQGAVAVVGARAATAYGEHVAGELAAGIAESGALVVSGGAYGIDGAAHRGALAVRGSTVAVLAGGADTLYPRGHTDLLERILRDGGALVSEVPCGTAPTRWRFLARNRLIAAFSAATVVVEAGARSGSLNTAGHAASIGRPLGAVPGPVTSAASIGCHRLLRDYDARCVTSAAEALELIGRGEPEPLDLGEWTGDRTRLRDALSRTTFREPGQVAARSGMAISEVEALLGALLLEGAVEHGAAGWRLRSG